jgi:hypothetical protein
MNMRALLCVLIEILIVLRTFAECVKIMTRPSSVNSRIVVAYDTLTNYAKGRGLV